MANALQRQRMAAIRSALALHRHRHFTPGYGLVVSGGAYAPDTNNSFATYATNNENFVPNDIVSPPLPTTPLVWRHPCLVVPCGARHFPCPLPNAGSSDILPLAVYSASRLTPTYPAAQDAFTLVVPGRFRLWHREGIG